MIIAVRSEEMVLADGDLSGDCEGTSSVDVPGNCDCFSGGCGCGISSGQGCCRILNSCGFWDSQEQESPEVPEKPGLEEPKPTAEPEKPGQEAPAQEPNPVELKPPPYMPELPHRPTMDGNRRVIFYDQRQSGKYNIRADLDNFMILVIPTSPSSPAMSGASILDFLSRGAMRRSQAKHAPKRKKGTKIHKVSVVKNDPIEDHAIEIPKDSPIHTIPPQPTAVDHFIEGRTPYKDRLDASRQDASPEDYPARGGKNSLNVGNVDAFGVPDKQYNEDWEWKLLGAQEQCGPDRKRDSYGICQFVPT
uniref:Uncharacterized protein n=1 Tax=Phlebotomus papatasi TaxID=29031 RepID=A0A1B0DQU5_PHLPP